MGLRDVPAAGVGLAGAWAVVCVAGSVLPAFDIHPVPVEVRQRFHFRWFDKPEVMRSEFLLIWVPAVVTAGVVLLLRRWGKRVAFPLA